MWLCPPECGWYSFRVQNKAEGLSPVDLGISRGVTKLYASRGYTHPVTRAIEVSQKHSALIEILSWSISQLEYIFSFFQHMVRTDTNAGFLPITVFPWRYSTSR